MLKSQQIKSFIKKYNFLLTITYLPVYNMIMKNINSKEELLECALTLFSEKGYESTGINEIVQMVGVTKPTLYYFFQSKEGIFGEILNRYYKKFNTILEKNTVYVSNAEVYENDVLPALLRIADAYFSFARENKKFYMMILSLVFAPPNTKTAALTKPYDTEQYEILTRFFQKVSETHKNIKGKEQLCACNFVAMLNANIGFWHRGFGEIGKQKAELIVNQFMHGIFS